MSDFGRMTEPGTVQIRRTLPGPIERVWAHLTESELRGGWLAAGPMEPRVGGEVALQFRNDRLSDGHRAPDKYRQIESRSEVAGRIVACEPPRRLAYSWGEGSEVTFELTPEDAGILLVVTHRNLTDREQMLGVSSGWHAHLDILAAKLAGTPSPPFWPNHTRLEAEYDRLLPKA